MNMLFIASQLAYLATAANFGTIFTVVLIFVSMVLFIRQFRLYEFDSSFESVVRCKREPQEKMVSKVKLPFSLKLGSHATSIDGNEVTLHSTSDVPCYIIACCHVEMVQLRTLLNRPWTRFIDFIENEVKLDPKTCVFTKEQAHEVKAFTVTHHPREEIHAAYALVSFQIAVGDTDGDDPSAMISLIHLPDKYCDSPPTILGQYLKFKDGRLLNLKPLYSTDNTKTCESQSGNTNCIICWMNPATRVLLPCRHACLCFQCFGRVENCPVCRTRIVSYFSI